jgi:hypothetical protein
MTIQNILKYSVYFILFLFPQIKSYSYPSMKDSIKRIKFQSKCIIIQNTSPEKVFAYMDEIGNTGAHMEKRSMAMMGSKLKLTRLSENEVGLNSKYLWKGKTMGFKMDFTVLTTKWENGKEKVWETIGKSKMIILDWYQMRLIISPDGENTKADLSIKYTKPRTFFFRAIGFFLAKPYAKWCLKNMLNDTKKHFDEQYKK